VVNATAEGVAEYAHHSQSADIIEQAQQRLGERLLTACLSVRCDFQAGTLRLQGRLSSFYEKQLAQEAVRSMRQVESITNDIIVGPRG
jgi:osmotically-inducible protein OsmY